MRSLTWRFCPRNLGMYPLLLYKNYNSNLIYNFMFIPCDIKRPTKIVRRLIFFYHKFITKNSSILRLCCYLEVLPRFFYNIGESKGIKVPLSSGVRA